MVSAERARLGVALGQNVHRPATDEPLCGEFQRGRPISFRLVLAASQEAYAVVLVADDPAVGDRSAIDVSCQVFEHLSRVALAVGRSLNEEIPIWAKDVCLRSGNA